MHKFGRGNKRIRLEKYKQEENCIVAGTSAETSELPVKNGPPEVPVVAHRKFR